MTLEALYQILTVRVVDRLRRDSGASLVEYALLLALIAMVCFAAVGFLGGKTSDGFSTFNSSFAAAADR
ncbi:MAG: Flp family type IVb pilin [Acidimicrobiia bacterium]